MYGFNVILFNPIVHIMWRNVEGRKQCRKTMRKQAKPAPKPLNYTARPIPLVGPNLLGRSKEATVERGGNEFPL